MGKRSQLIFLTLLVSILCYTYSAGGYISENHLVFDQVAFRREAVIGDNITVGIFIKNFFNYTITNITVSLNLTDINHLKFTSCSLGILSGDNITLNETMMSPIVNEFTSVNITGLFMTEKYLEYNVTEIMPDRKMIFFYNVTSLTISDLQVPWSYMSYYDNWLDLQKDVRSQNRFILSFVSGIPSIDPHLPQWDIGNTIPEGWAWVIYGLVPVIIAALAVLFLYFNRR